jgi:threonine dehydrogenase-like Zn-dependent dehydrogenase
MIKQALPVLTPDATAVVIGVGGLGHLAVQILRAMTAVRTVALDVRHDKLARARELGADVILRSDRDAGQTIREITRGVEADAMFDVVGAAAIVNMYESVPDMAEFTAVGAAAKHREGVMDRAPNGRPFTSALSGQEFGNLLRFGHRPVGMVMGNCVYHVAHQSMRRAMRNTGQNVELVLFTQASYDARELAIQRMQAEAKDAEARGIVGVRTDEGSFIWGVM